MPPDGERIEIIGERPCHAGSDAAMRCEFTYGGHYDFCERPVTANDPAPTPSAQEDSA